jgi:hypothetical protein
MYIEILSVSVEDKGKYKMAEINYKGQDGKPAQKKLASFTNADVFKTLTGAASGSGFDIDQVKNDKGYWDWTKATSATSAKAAASTGNASPKSTYETAEERAQRQILIVRQSSLSSAIALLGTKASPQQAIEVAGLFEQYVFGKQEKENDGFENFESDIL